MDAVVVAEAREGATGPEQKELGIILFSPFCTFFYFYYCSKAEKMVLEDK